MAYEEKIEEKSVKTEKTDRKKYIAKDYEKKIGGLIAKMTLKEKIGQLIQMSPSIFGAFGLTKDEIIEKLVNGEISTEEYKLFTIVANKNKYMTLKA